jgi:histidine ammonia-lyase
MTPQTPLSLDGRPLLPNEVAAVARDSRRVDLHAAATAALHAARAVVEHATTDGLPHYGINTGFGSLARTRIATDQLRDLQRNLVRSHAAGVGSLLPREVVRAMMLILAASLARGRSGVRPVVVERLLDLLNHDLTPAVPEIGSVGASGDLAPLAHLALVLIGEGEILSESGIPASEPAGPVLARHNITPLTLEAKEGLALINGTHLMAARGSLLVEDARTLLDAAVAASAMSIDACRATDAFLDDRVHAVRQQPGQRDIARRVRTLLAGSQIIPSHAENDPRVQDPYSLRCIPQVLGAAADAMNYVRGCVERELGAVTDNPLVFPTSPPTAHDIVSAGNFHGMPLAIPLDTATIALAHIAGISERRTFLMLAAADPEAHLRPYLSPHPGVSSGLMIAQYTAAACCNEIITLATPASVSNIGTSAGIEDYNSFGPRAAAKAARALDLARHVIAIELLCAAQALEYHRPLRSGAGVEAAYAAVRAVVPPLSSDRPPAPDIARIAGLIAEGRFGGGD